MHSFIFLLEYFDSKPNGETVHLLTIWIWQMINWFYISWEFGGLNLKKSFNTEYKQSTWSCSILSAYNPWRLWLHSPQMRRKGWAFPGCRILKLNFTKYSSRSVTYFKSWHCCISMPRDSHSQKAFLISLGNGNKSWLKARTLP